LNDPIALGPFWAQFEDWSDAERTAVIAPSLNKLRPFVVRPEIRGILGQSDPSFHMSDIFRHHKILLVNLAKGELGPESSALLGALIVSQLWQTVLRRSTVAPEKRHPVFVYVDEFQDYLRLPVDPTHNRNRHDEARICVLNLFIGGPRSLAISTQFGASKGVRDPMPE